MILRLENVEAGYGKVTILKGISIGVNEGEIVAIIGPNGSGKSTILKSILSLVETSNGRIIFDDKSIEKKKAHEIVRLGLSYVPQGRLVFPTLTVEENLKIGGYLLKKDKLSRRLGEVYEKYPGLKEKKNQRATFLSGGQQQLLSIARALLLNPKMLLLDEPSLGLGPIAIKDVFKEIKRLHDDGVTILIVEQNAHLALEISDRVYVLEAGKIAFEGGKELSEKKEMRDLYFGH